MHAPVIPAPAALALATHGRAAGWLARGRARLQRLTKGPARTHSPHTRQQHTSTKHTGWLPHNGAGPHSSTPGSAALPPHTQRSVPEADGQCPQHAHRDPQAHRPLHACKHTNHIGWTDAHNSASAPSMAHACGPAALGTALQGSLALGTAGWPPLGPRLARLASGCLGTAASPRTTMRARPDPPRRTTEPPRRTPELPKDHPERAQPAPRNHREKIRRDACTVLYARMRRTFSAV